MGNWKNMGKSKNSASPVGNDEVSSLSTETDFDVTMEIAETDALEERLDEFASITGKAVFIYTSILDGVLGDSEHSIFYKKYVLWKRLELLRNRYQAVTCELEELDKESSILSEEEENNLQEFGTLYETCNSLEKEELLRKYGKLTEMWINREG